MMTDKLAFKINDRGEAYRSAKDILENEEVQAQIQRVHEVIKEDVAKNRPTQIDAR